MEKSSKRQNEVDGENRVFNHQRSAVDKVTKTATKNTPKKQTTYKKLKTKLLQLEISFPTAPQIQDNQTNSPQLNLI